VSLRKLFGYFFWGCVFVGLMVLLGGCSSVPLQVGATVDLGELYRDAVGSGVVEDEGEMPVVSCSFRSASLSEFGAWVASYGCGFVASTDMADASVTADFKDATMGEVVYWVGRRLKVDVAMVGRTYFFGEVRREDLAWYVGAWRGDVAEAEAVLSTIISSSGKVTVSNGRVVVTDSRRVIDRVRSVLDALNAAGRDVWVVQLAFLRWANSEGIGGGVDLSATGSVAVALADGGTGGVGHDVTLSGLVSAYQRDESRTVEALPCFVLADGQEGTWSDGEVVSVPRKSVSESGTVTVVGYDQINVGADYRVTVFGLTSSRAELLLSLRVGSVVGFVGDYPSMVEGVYKGRLDMETGKPYLIGQFNMVRRTFGRSGWLDRRREGSKDTVQVWAELRRIAGPKPGAAWLGRVPAVREVPQPSGKRVAGAGSVPRKRGQAASAVATVLENESSTKDRGAAK
jgi:hypothetical protein